MTYVDPAVFLGPLMEAKRSEEITRTIASLTSLVSEFLSSWLVYILDRIAVVVTDARLDGTLQTSHGIVLTKIAKVFRTFVRIRENILLKHNNKFLLMINIISLVTDSPTWRTLSWTTPSWQPTVLHKF
nr:uncharacterized protein LOC115257332 [Aedes albopictus]